MFAFAPVSRSAIVPGSAAFVFGAAASAGYTNAIRKFTPTYNSTESATLASTINKPGVSSLGNACLIFGGRTSASVSINTIASFDGTTRTNKAAVLAATNFSSGCTTVSTNVFIFGGGATSTTLGTTIQRFDGTTRSTDGATIARSGTIPCTAVTLGSSAYIFYSGVTNTPLSKYDGATITAAVANMVTAISENMFGVISTNMYFASGVSFNKFDGTTLSTAGTPPANGVCSMTIDDTIYIVNNATTVFSFNSAEVTTTLAQVVSPSGGYGNGVSSTLSGVQNFTFV